MGSTQMGCCSAAPSGKPIIMTRMFIGFNTFSGLELLMMDIQLPMLPVHVDYGESRHYGSGTVARSNIRSQTLSLRWFATTATVQALVTPGADNRTLRLIPCTANDCQALYNTKDGFIGPHTWITNLTITNSTSIGNMGQSWKWGGRSVPATVTFTNNLTVANCNRMSQPLPGAPSNYNQHLTLFCRASGMVVGSAIPAGSTWTIANSTWITYQPTTFYIACPVQGPCPSTVNFTDNIFVGYTNPLQPAFSGEGPALYLFNDASIKRVTSHNMEYGMRNGGLSEGRHGEYMPGPEVGGTTRR